MSAHIINECVHGTVVSQCRCPGPKAKILVPCPASCAEEAVELHPKFSCWETPQARLLVTAINAWLTRAEFDHGVVKASRVIEAIENQGWRLTYVGKEE